ncbi:autophagy-related protein 18h-like isoform X2 [Juglans microcarpa x Juglans regia]|uniref:autophagy-related protein 18h-like isoform X2 n=1 Tax=Juglans microcarpa x Juglans regia TaxID=2249226 RepID=UPI001B7DE7C8|nr:autophagy-related protein 18h-like isoform X2 [Juglans microcarpa x Juglans regia]
MKNHANYNKLNGNCTTTTTTNHNNRRHGNGFFPTSLKFISSCLKTASSGVRSASTSISADNPDHKDQPLPAKSEGREGFRPLHPLLLVVACDESKSSGLMHSARDGLVRDGFTEPQTGAISPNAVRFYSLRSHIYVHVLRFRSTVYMVRCSPQIVAVGLATQIYCFDALTLENKFSVLTYPVPQFGSQGMGGVNIGYGPMAVGPRWLAYASNNSLLSNAGRLSPQSLTPQGVSPSTSPGSGSLVARYAMESSKQLAAGLINLGDMGYKTLSKYCQELIPDGSNSPISSNSSWKVGRIASHMAETDNAGMVVVKDFGSRAVVSQFRAHTSPISALCFDPSGTLLVTASIHGNNINIFRIMPSSSHNGSFTQPHDSGSSYVHLYKLHRGMTSAVIQDICFSHYSQWIAIVSSRGTCHVFALSPFGGETVLKIQNSHIGPTLLPVTSLPWWSTTSFMINQQCFSPLPPPPVILSVVSRIKNSQSGWLNQVSNAASSAVGKVSIPSGAIAAVFHNSVPHDLLPAHLKGNALENLLVYTPCGHTIQYELLTSMGGESNEAASTGPGSSLQIQDEELRVKVEPVRWWDICRSDWPEREEYISGITLGRQETAEMVMDTSDCEDNYTGNKELVKPIEQSHLYISNAEVQISSSRIPIWQNYKISFQRMSFGTSDLNFTESHTRGEIEIEKLPVHEIEIRRRDLLPVIDHFLRSQSDWSDRSLVGVRCLSPSSNSHETKDKFSEDPIVCHSKLASLGTVENSDGLSGESYTSITLPGTIQMWRKKGDLCFHRLC